MGFFLFPSFLSQRLYPLLRSALPIDKIGHSQLYTAILLYGCISILSPHRFVCMLHNQAYIHLPPFGICRSLSTVLSSLSVTILSWKKLLTWYNKKPCCIVTDYEPTETFFQLGEVFPFAVWGSWSKKVVTLSNRIYDWYIWCKTSK